MKALRLVMLWALTIFSSQLWGYSSTTELTYRYDAFDSYFFSLNTQPETQNRNYDENSNFRYSGRKYIDSYYQKKTQSGSFFVFEVGFVATKGLLNPQTIRFTQDSIKGTFKDGRSVTGLIDALKSGAVKASDLPAIRTFTRDGQLFSLDNRRLFAFQQAGVKIRTVPATASEIANEAFKFTSKNGGTSIRVRGGGG